MNSFARAVGVMLIAAFAASCEDHTPSIDVSSFEMLETKINQKSVTREEVRGCYELVLAQRSTFEYALSDQKREPRFTIDIDRIGDCNKMVAMYNLLLERLPPDEKNPPRLEPLSTSDVKKKD